MFSPEPWAFRLVGGLFVCDNVSLGRSAAGARIQRSQARHDEYIHATGCKGFRRRFCVCVSLCEGAARSLAQIWHNCTSVQLCVGRLQDLG